MLFIFLSVFIPVAVYFTAPKVISAHNGKPAESQKLLAIACFLLFLSWHLPSPEIKGQHTAFITHFVGGGVFSAFVWLYIRKQLGKNFSLLQDLVAIYALASALGVANELFELAITEAGIARLTPSDAWWDLLANTLGAVLVWLAVAAKRLISR